LSDVSLITVNFKSTRLINEIEMRLSQFKIELIVVDNSGDFVAIGPRTTVISSKSNIGFGRACNFGARHASGRVLVFFNPDLEFDKNNLEKLIQISSEHEKGSIWSPAIINGDGKVSALSNFKNAGLIYRRYNLTVSERSTRLYHTIYASGACMVVEREEFLSIGGFSEDVFLYGEDLELCIRARKAGLQVYVRNDVNVAHKGGNSSSQMDRWMRLYRSSYGHYIVLRLLGYDRLRSTINALYLASGIRF
jgi:N-acetylglucosaminyl-diphospho-decaprenol L-rhamnosyltransferase